MTQDTVTAPPVPLLEASGQAGEISQPRPRRRLKTDNLPPLPLDVVEFDGCRLPTLQKGAWMELLIHFWKHQSIPETLKGRAEIAGVHVRTWKAMETAIAPHFDIDDAGRWRHYDLEEARSALKAKADRRSLANKNNARARWTSDEEASAGEADEAENHRERDANGNANGIKKSPQNEAGGNADRNPPGSSSPRTDRLTDCSLPEEKGSVRQSLADPERDAGAGANPAAAHANDTGDRNAGGSADGMAKSTVSNTRIEEIVRRAVTKGGGHLDAGWQSSKCLETLQSAFGEGCDPQRHYEPALLAFTERATDKRIRNPANDPVMRAAWQLRGRDLAKAGESISRRPDTSQLGPRDKLLHQALEDSIGADSYASWCGSLAMSSVDGDVATLLVSSRFVRHYLEKTFDRQLLAAARKAAPDIRKVIVEVRAR